MRKLGEKILPEIIPILEDGLRSDKSDERQGVCIGLSEIMKSTSKDAVSLADTGTHTHITLHKHVASSLVELNEIKIIDDHNRTNIRTLEFFYLLKKQDHKERSFSHNSRTLTLIMAVKVPDINV